MPKTDVQMMTRPAPWHSALTRLLAVIGAVTLVTWFAVDLTGGDRPVDGGRSFARFMGSALNPALEAENPHSTDFLSEITEAARLTILVAFAAMSLAIVLGAVLGCLASQAFWSRDPLHDAAEPESRRVDLARAGIINGIRVVMGFMRSIHEIFWALLAIAAFGLSVICGILALAIPYAATLGRIYAELLDETAPDAARALRRAGASRTGAFLLGVLPRAAGPMLSYTFFRFDCAVRSSAILGFIGFPTLGLNIHAAVRYDHYREAWTYLYVLFALLVVTELVSSELRKRIAVWR